MQRQVCIGFSIVIILLMACGCSINTFNAKSDSGDPDAPRALFMTEKYVAISSIDGKNVFVTARNWWVPIVTKTKASVIPGEHTLVIKYAQTGWSSLGCQVTMDAEPGKRYVVKGKRLPFENADGFVTAKLPQINKVIVWIEDSETGSKVVDEIACKPVTS